MFKCTNVSKYIIRPNLAAITVNGRTEYAAMIKHTVCALSCFIFFVWTKILSFRIHYFEIYFENDNCCFRSHLIGTCSAIRQHWSRYWLIVVLSRHQLVYTLYFAFPHFAEEAFECIFVNEKWLISIKMSPKFVPEGSIDNNLQLV